jgi:hypothetical protein
VVIELLDFNLRGGRDAPTAAARLANVTERYLTASAIRDLTAAVTEMVGWLGADNAPPHTLRLELSVTSSVVRVSVTRGARIGMEKTPASNQLLRQTLPVTAALASRYGVEASRRTRVWAEFDRSVDDGVPQSESQYSS